MIPTTPRRANLSAPALLFTLALLAAPSHAQYLYLDSNGDGVHTDADVLYAQGVNQVNIWLDTAHNRDGSLAICDTGDGDMTFFSYGVALSATGGTVTYNLVNARTEMTVVLEPMSSNATEFVAGYGGFVFHPPGRYLLLSGSISATGGTPSVAVIPDSPLGRLGSGYTWFGTACSGRDFDNTYKLVGTMYGTGDFTDVDGLQYSAGGGPVNSPPALAPPADMTVSVGEVKSQVLLATDPDGNPVQFALESGPTFLFLETVASAPGSATGRIVARPRTSDIGVGTANVCASDGLVASCGSFLVTVVSGPNHPPRFSPLEAIRVEAGATAREVLYAADADGDAIDFRKAQGPSYASVTTSASGAGGAFGFLTATPSACDVGSSTVTIAASDGALEVEAIVRIDVVAPRPRPSPATRSISSGRSINALVSGDWNRDGHNDIAAVSEVGNSLVVLLGNGDGTFVAGPAYSVGGSASSVVAGDWDQDGRPDLAVGGFTGSVTIFKGIGDGSFRWTQTLDAPGRAIRAGDVDGNGSPDLVMSRGSDLLVAINAGGGVFTLGPRTVVGGGWNAALALSDFDRDGCQDVVVGMPNGLRFGHGIGNGSFALGPIIPIEDSPFVLEPGDLNGDGAIDLVSVGGSHAVITLLGNGAGAFVAKSVSELGPSDPWSGALADWDGDGVLDAIATTYSTAILYVVRGDGQGGLEWPPLINASQPYAQLGAAVGDFDEDGRVDIAYGTFSDGGFDNVTVLFNSRTPRSGGTARTFLRGEGPLPLASSSRQVPLFIEPIAGLDVADIDVASLRIHSQGTGSVDEIGCSSKKDAVIGDADENGVSDLMVRLASSDIVRLFDAIDGRRTVTVTLDGRLHSGGSICSRFDLDILAVGPPRLAVGIAPNPLNPSGKLSVTTTRPGLLRVRIFDLQGRLIQTVIDLQGAPADRYELPIGGASVRGGLASGIYFYRVDSGAEVRSGRFAVLK